ncbi:MAG: hypothetical protein GEU94_16680 [Micromonosporaceae bacterium]|nr:hypothetical protein [Micromonosporaceae bacterium]
MSTVTFRGDPGFTYGVVGFLPPRRPWPRSSGRPPRFPGGGDGPPGDDGHGRKRSGGWPLWPAIALITAVAVVLTAVSMVLTIAAGDAGPPYPPGP